jgi:hypothetical protein
MSGYLDVFGNDLNTRFAVGSGGTLTGYKDLAGNDLNTRFAPYVSGAIGSLTGYKDLSGNDLNGRFAPIIPPPNFPTLQSSISGIGSIVCVDMDGVNCVVSTQGGSPSGDTYTYLYWSDNSCETLNRATIGGVSNQKFWGCVAISGPNAIAMGRLTSGGTNTFYLSSDYGKTYTVTSTSGQTAAGGISDKVYINISGTNAVWSSFTNSRLVYYSTNSGLTWTASNINVFANAMVMFQNNVYICTNSGFYYSTNGGQSFILNSMGVTNSVTQVGTNIYIGAQNKIYKLLSTSLSSAPPIFLTPLSYIITIASCSRPSGGDFLVFSNDSSNYFYSNNGGTITTISTIGQGYKLFVNSSRIIASLSSNNLYWGKNNFIT